MNSPPVSTFVSPGAIRLPDSHREILYISTMMQLGASDGTITDFATKLSVFFRDPDGLEAEVLWNKDPASQEDKI
jgi:hypothetical protein